MFKWMKSLGKKEVEKQKSPLEEDVRKLVDEKEKTSLLISEPVTSFLKCFKQNPRRFKIVKTKASGYYSSTRYTVTDRKTSESWTISHRPYVSEPHIESASWLTQDERDLLNHVITTYLAERALRLYQIRIDKAQVKIDKERARLTKIYKENEE